MVKASKSSGRALPRRNFARRLGRLAFRGTGLSSLRRLSDHRTHVYPESAALAGSRLKVHACRLTMSREPTTTANGTLTTYDVTTRRHHRQRLLILRRLSYRRGTSLGLFRAYRPQRHRWRCCTIRDVILNLDWTKLGPLYENPTTTFSTILQSLNLGASQQCGAQVSKVLTLSSSHPSSRCIRRSRFNRS